MAYQVIIKKRFTNKLLKVLAYLEKEWSLQVASSFLAKTDRRLLQLSNHPFISAPSQKVKRIRSVLITKHNRLYYKVSNKAVIVLNMYDTRMNPQGRKY